MVWIWKRKQQQQGKWHQRRRVDRGNFHGTATMEVTEQHRKNGNDSSVGMVTDVVD